MSLSNRVLGAMDGSWQSEHELTIATGLSERDVYAGLCKLHCRHLITHQVLRTSKPPDPKTGLHQYATTWRRLTAAETEKSIAAQATRMRSIRASYD